MGSYMSEKRSLSDDEGTASPGFEHSAFSFPERKESLPQWSKSSDAVQSASIKTKIINLQCILLNTVSTVTVVIMNKIVFSDPQLRNCQISVAAWHFVATSCVLYFATCSPFNLFKAVRLPIMQMLPICVFFAGFLLLGNLSLAFNTVGFYQLAKIMTTPCVVLLNFILFRSTVSWPTMLAIAAVCVGVATTNTKLALSNPLGGAIATAAFTVTALYQIWIGKKIVDLDVSAPQLLLNQAPVSVLILLVVLPFIDAIPDLSSVSSNSLWILFASGIIASLLNLSQFMIIGRTSALTFNIVSNLKTIIIVSLSWYQEATMLTLQDIFGVALAIGGACAYSQLSQKSKS